MVKHIGLLLLLLGLLIGAFVVLQPKGGGVSSAATMPVIPTPHTVYLPLVYSYGNPPSLACEAPIQLVANPGFEDGIANWTARGNVLTETRTVNSGTGAVSLGGSVSATDAISQTITVPAWANMLYFETLWYMASADLSGIAHDDLFIALSNWGGPIAGAWIETDNQQGQWYGLGLVVPAARYRGQVLTVRLTATNDAADATTWFIDDVRVTARCS